VADHNHCRLKIYIWHQLFDPAVSTSVQVLVPDYGITNSTIECTGFKDKLESKPFSLVRFRVLKRPEIYGHIIVVASRGTSQSSISRQRFGTSSIYSYLAATVPAAAAAAAAAADAAAADRRGHSSCVPMKY
jgi:hypothetical protein